ncbi:hypothetical protein A4A49_62696, partial [Nicotiana attenuata]
QYLLEQKVTSAMQQKGLTKLLGLDYEVQYKKRAENRVADALSRQFESLPTEAHHQAALLAISMNVPVCVQEISASYEEDALDDELIAQLAIDLQGPQIWQYTSGVLRNKGKIYIGTRGTLRQQLISIFHDSTIGGHSRQLGTYKSPFEALYGFSPPQLSMGPLLETTFPVVVDVMMQRQQMQQLLKDNLLKAQERMKLHADQKSTEREFQVGDMVYLKLQPYRQTSLALRRNLKLSSKYYGHYQILSRVGQVAYKLLMTPTSKVHLVFHVSLLKRKIGSRAVVQSVLPRTSDEGQFLVKPVAILQRQLVQKGNVADVKVLIQWSNLPPEDATWEDYDFIKAKFP